MPPSTEISSNDLSRLFGLHLTQARRLRRRYLAAMNQQHFTVTDLPVLNRAIGLAQLELPNGRSRFEDALTQILQGAAGKAALSPADWTRYVDLRQQFEHQQINLGALWKILCVHLRIETALTEERFQELAQNAVQALLRGHELETLIEEALGRALASELHLTTLLTGPVWPDASTTSSWTETPAGQIIQMLTALLERQPVNAGRIFEGTMVLLTAQESMTLQHLPALPDAVATQVMQTCRRGQQLLDEQLQTRILPLRVFLEQRDRLQRVVHLIEEDSDAEMQRPNSPALLALADRLDAATRVLLQRCSDDQAAQVFLNQHSQWDQLRALMADHLQTASPELLALWSTQVDVFEDEVRNAKGRSELAEETNEDPEAAPGMWPLDLVEQPVSGQERHVELESSQVGMFPEAHDVGVLENYPPVKKGESAEQLSPDSPTAWSDQPLTSCSVGSHLRRDDVREVRESSEAAAAVRGDLPLNLTADGSGSATSMGSVSPLSGADVHDESTAALPGEVQHSFPVKASGMPGEQVTVLTEASLPLQEREIQSAPWSIEPGNIAAFSKMPDTIEDVQGEVPGQADGRSTDGGTAGEGCSEVALPSVEELPSATDEVEVTAETADHLASAVAEETALSNEHQLRLGRSPTPAVTLPTQDLVLDRRVQEDARREDTLLPTGRSTLLSTDQEATFLSPTPLALEKVQQEAPSSMTIVGAVETGALERPVATDELRAEGEVSTELLTGDDVMRETEGLLTRCRDLERQLEPVLKDAAERARLFPQVTSLYNRYCELEALDVTATIHPDDLERFLRVGTRLQELQQVLLP